mgnify:CR=1 FL=1
MIKMTFKVLSPVHISNGDILVFGIHYGIDDSGHLGKFNLMRIAKFLNMNDPFTVGKTTGPEEIVKKMLGNYSKYDEKCFDYKIDTQTVFASQVSNAKKRNIFGEIEVKEFINANGSFYVPGSSIKGTIVTALGLPYLGINPENNEGNYSEERFVINDSNSISNDNFCVFQTNARETKPREIKAYFICLMPNAKFELIIQKAGKLKANILLSKLRNYSSKQIDELKNYLIAFIDNNDESSKALSESLDYILDKSNKLENNESLINIGLGGGNWFKVSEGKPSEKPAHTGFTFGSDEKLRHMGWCKVKIEEID